MRETHLWRKSPTDICRDHVDDIWHQRLGEDLLSIGIIDIVDQLKQSLPLCFLAPILESVRDQALRNDDEQQKKRKCLTSYLTWDRRS